MLRDRIFKIIFFIILIGLFIFGIYEFYKNYFISVDKTKETIEYSNSEVDIINARNYIQTVESTIISELFNTNIIAGKYIVNGNKIIYQSNDNIYYEITIRGNMPKEGSTIILENDKVKEAELKYEKNNIYYDGLNYAIKDI